MRVVQGRPLTRSAGRPKQSIDLGPVSADATTTVVQLQPIVGAIVAPGVEIYGGLLLLWAWARMVDHGLGRTIPIPLSTTTTWPVITSEQSTPTTIAATSSAVAARLSGALPVKRAFVAS
jgi:hypothetical protein